MVKLPVLILPDFKQLFVIETDASGAGIGNRPITYISQGFSDKGKIKSEYERELLAIVFAITKWSHYMIGNKVITRTDQHSLKYLLDQKSVPTERTNMGFKAAWFELHHRVQN